jgi:hypothetical protein
MCKQAILLEAFLSLEQLVHRKVLGLQLLAHLVQLMLNVVVLSN